MAIILESSGFTDERPAAGLFITDLDGTLLNTERELPAAARSALQRLGGSGVVRVVATGRSLYSFNTVASAGWPVDFVIFSTGAGVLQHPGGRILRRVSLENAEVCTAFDALCALGLDVMVQRPIPDSHEFGFKVQNASNPDFERRLALYHPFAFPLDGGIGGFGPATQLVAIVPADEGRRALAAVRSRLAGFTVVQTTSPLDGRSTWIEVFPAEVSKSLTAAWLAAKLGVPRERTVSVGNDYNDLDLLEWTGTRFVVANAPGDLGPRFPRVASNNEGGVAEAVDIWLAGTADAKSSAQ
ncbi:MAG: HAD family hydrolase [Desulfobacterales bacterium]